MKPHALLLAIACALLPCLVSVAAQTPARPLETPLSPASPPAEKPPSKVARLLLVHETPTGPGEVHTGVMKPFDVYLVAEREGEQHQISTVAFKLDVPDGVVVMGEELLVESLVGLGTSRDGLDLVFRCVDSPQVRVLRFRMVATRALKNASVRLLPETRTNLLGVVTCKDENYEKIECPPVSLAIDVHP